MTGPIDFELLWAPRHLPPPKMLHWPLLFVALVLGGSLGFSLVSLMDNLAPRTIQEPNVSAILLCFGPVALLLDKVILYLTSVDWRTE